MAPLVKLAILFKMGKEASLLEKLACLSYSLYTVVEKQQYLVSTSSYKLSVKKYFTPHVHAIPMVLTKSCEMKWQSYEVLCNCYI